MVARVALSAAALALSVLVLALGACSDALPTTPTPATRPPVGQGGLAGGDGSGGGGDAETAALAGTWEALLFFSLPDDVITTRTTWRFDADGGCSRTVTTLSAAEGVPLTSVRECTFAIGPAEIVVSYAGGEDASFTLSLLALPDTILLDGIAYQRVG
jgi:hypothetical protein